MSGTIILTIRLAACLIWFVDGILAGGLTGYLSSLASMMFFVAGVSEAYFNKRPLKGELK